MKDDFVACRTQTRTHNLWSILRVVGWNLLLITVGLLLVGAAGEAYFRLTVPFSDSSITSTRTFPGVGTLAKPNTEMSFTNNVDFWTVQRSNSLGFLDREPIAPDRARESCHITIIGDSFVEAIQVQISEKVQVQLEELAAMEKPSIDLTASAFGIQITGQVHQLLFYDVYARHLSPDLVVLVFVVNDALDNSTVSDSLLYGVDPDVSPYVSAVMNSDGVVELRMPNAEIPQRLLSPTRDPYTSWSARVINWTVKTSLLARWLQFKLPWLLATSNTDREFIAEVQELMRRQDHAWMFNGWIPTSPADIDSLILDSESNVYREVWGITEFALEQFKRRANHDGAAVMILATYPLGDEGDPMFDILNGIATSLGIPVVSQQNYITHQGYSISDAHFPNDGHWSPKGHRWAAEAVWEYIKEEWNGECPSAVRDPYVEVDWIKVGHHVHTPKGKVWSDVFPKDLNLYREAYASVTADPPTVSSDWNVHLYDEGVTYIRDRCTTENVENHFFLHVIPEDVQDLPEDRRDNGFESITFHIPSRGAMFDGKCLASIDLPRYEIDRIRTGQFVRRDIDSEDWPVWRIDYNLALPELLDVVKELLRSDREPEIRSSFDVYVDDGQLVYVKESCSVDDRDLLFFLHVFPVDGKEVVQGSEETGFNSINFGLIEEGGMHDGSCFAAVDLPEYDIASIRTGQVAEDMEAWRAYYNLALPEIRDTVQELLQSKLKPEIRSNFDVYVDDDRLIYVKDSCSIDDRDLPFFMHVFPTDENDLPDSRQEFGFDNLDFELWQNGGESDGLCFAVVNLPAYEIMSIRTGQWVRGEGNVWEARIELTE